MKLKVRISLIQQLADGQWRGEGKVKFITQHIVFVPQERSQRRSITE